MLLLRRFVHNCPQCGQLRDFERVLFWICNIGDDVFCAGIVCLLSAAKNNWGVPELFRHEWFLGNCGTESNKMPKYFCEISVCFLSVTL